jgi:hypothetical protein
MVDFQIRDVMGRRSKADASVTLRFIHVDRTPDLLRRQLAIRIANVGSVMLEKWWLDVDVPARVLRDTRNPHLALMLHQPNFGRLVSHVSAKPEPIARVGFGDPPPVGMGALVRPGQTLDLDSGHANFAEILIEVGRVDVRLLAGTPIRWVLYLHAGEPKRGEVSFDEWAQGAPS